MPSNVAELKPRTYTTSSMRLISQRKEINCFEGMGQNGLCLMRILCLFNREQCFRGREEINLLVYSYHSILPILYPFSFFVSFLFFSFLVFTFFFFLGDSFLDVAITVFFYCHPYLPLVCMARPLFIAPAVTGFYYFSL